MSSQVAMLVAFAVFALACTLFILLEPDFRDWRRREHFPREEQHPD